ncbi:hypothetical protein DES53_11596 [Roseimicrobium gellanilyticum]|uniref:Uncharacterized protein n=1 Tax=Roseimicrobium gellanilyticum TaxID=748857 RepID=A0A366H4L7_9BACT|nr:hypothetical protein [Roseimicrobium gellanilyticum]RBP36955.1 hypothetical protein DES53_11596 [Roseimicrobium gellanilyticum]
MSRRAKIILACLFTVLLGIPLGYAWFTWRPVDPLRFRATALREQHYRSREHVDFQVYEIEVENTSGVPIRILHGEVGLEYDTVLGPISSSGIVGFLGKDDTAHFADRTLSHTILEDAITVPAYGKVRCTAGIYQDATAIMSTGQIHIAYEWMSGTKEVMLGVTSWVQKHLLARGATAPPSFPSTDRNTALVNAQGLHLPATRSTTPAP